MNKKKVLFLITKATWGGAQRYVYDVVTRLPKDQFDVITAYGTEGKLAEDLQKANIATRQLPALGRDVAVFSDIASFFQILKCIRAVRPDVIHLNSSKAAALGALAARLVGVNKIIFTVHGWPFKESRNILAKFLIYEISWLTTFLSHATIVISNDDEKIARRMWFVAHKINRVPLGIGPPSFSSREHAERALGVSGAVPRIVTIAELTRNKGIRYAIEAVAEMKRRGAFVSYSVIGDGEERTILESRVRELDVGDCVKFLGFLPNVSTSLTAFDIFLLPSIKEGLPYVLLEAATAGLPIVATDVVKSEASHLLNAYFVEPGSGKALADAIEELIKNMPEKSPVAVNSLSVMLEQTTALYT